MILPARYRVVVVYLAGVANLVCGIYAVTKGAWVLAIFLLVLTPFCIPVAANLRRSATAQREPSEPN